MSTTQFNCVFCKKEFKWLSYLLIHIRKHTGEAPFFCPTCPKSFAIQGNLLLHARIHSGVKPYSCKKCKICFVQKGNLRKQHSMRKPFHNRVVVAKDSSNKKRKVKRQRRPQPYPLIKAIKLEAVDIDSETEMCGIQNQSYSADEVKMQFTGHDIVKSLHCFRKICNGNIPVESCGNVKKDLDDEAKMYFTGQDIVKTEEGLMASHLPVSSESSHCFANNGSIPVQSYGNIRIKIEN